MKYELLILMMLLAPAVLAQEVSNIPVDVSLLSYNPVPAKPGDLLDVYVQIKNNDDDAAEQVHIQAIDNDVFKPQGDTTINAGTINAKSTYVAKFRVKVSPAAPSGDNLLVFLVDQNNLNQQLRTVNISVLEHDTNLHIVSVDAGIASPGDSYTVKLIIQSNTNNILRDVSAKLTLSNTPFVPLMGSDKKTISELSANSQAVFEYRLQVKPSAAADVYRIPVTIEYLDELGDIKEQNETIGLLVNAPAQMRAYLQDVAWVGDELEVSMRIVNKGLSEVKFVELTIGDSEDYIIASQQLSRYVGNIDTDDWETIRFSIMPLSEQIVVPVNYSFEDAFNTPYYNEQSFVVDVPARDENNSSLFIIIIVLLAVLLAWYLFKRKKNRR